METYDVIIIGTGAGGGTLARYLAPSGEAIHGKGLKPDVEVEDVDVTEFGAAPTSDADPILDAAVARVAKKAA